MHRRDAAGNAHASGAPPAGMAVRVVAARPVMVPSADPLYEIADTYLAF